MAPSAPRRRPGMAARTWPYVGGPHSSPRSRKQVADTAFESSDHVLFNLALFHCKLTSILLDILGAGSRAVSTVHRTPPYLEQVLRQF